ncbi:hypothetical protein [Nocardia yamanashiensis]|uniref:hypothetical protein n=1 Tax=Nocardia yamanashiensis TaxID=209247 RepID=UPI000A8DB3EF|nr:hypothetical protein [Nocardia yamanashiensis]
MSCSTAFVLRDADGRCLLMGQKQSWWDLTRADHLAEALAAIRQVGVPAERASSDFLGRYHCNGFALDLLEKRCHLYVCGEGQGATYFDSYAARFGAQPLWAGWEVRYAWGGHEELALAIPQAAGAVSPDLRPPATSSSTPFFSRDEWFIDWDPVRREITVRESEWSADWQDSPCAVLSVIGTGNAVLDYRLEDEYVLDWLAEQGASGVAVLDREAPYPLPHESLAHAGAVIDTAAKRLSYWTFTLSRPALHDYVVDAWPGWRVERLPFGYACHLAVTGRADHQVLIEREQLLASYWWDEALVTHREQACRSASLSPAMFQFCRVIAAP